MAFGEGYTGCGKSNCREKESLAHEKQGHREIPPKNSQLCIFPARKPLDYLETSLSFVSLVRLRISGNFPNGRSQGLAEAGDAL